MAESVEIDVSGKKIIGDFYPASSDELIIMCHGLLGDRHEHGRFDKIASEFNDTGFNVFSFDFRGSGESDDEAITIEKEVFDLATVLAFYSKKGFKKIGLFGHSLGGLVCLKNHARARAIGLTAPVTNKDENPLASFSEKQVKELNETGILTVADSSIDASRKKVRLDRTLFLELSSLELKDLSGVDCPVMIVHGSEDKDVKLEDSLNAINLMSSDSRLYLMKGTGHDFAKQTEEISEIFIDWFKKQLSG